MNKFQTESGTARQEPGRTGGHMAKEFIEIVLAKCDERERMGYGRHRRNGGGRTPETLESARI